VRKASISDFVSAFARASSARKALISETELDEVRANTVPGSANPATAKAMPIEPAKRVVLSLAIIYNRLLRYTKWSEL
jgi:hypothetical protein